jgi:hypothetical protein
MTNIMQKLNVRNRVEAVMKFHRANTSARDYPGYLMRYDSLSLG